MTPNPAGRPPLRAPSNAKRRIISVTCTDDEWRELLAMMADNTRDRYWQVRDALRAQQTQGDSDDGN